MSETSGNVRQQIGEILGTVRALDERMKERQREAREGEQLLHQELRTVKHDQRAGEQILSLRSEKTKKEIAKLAEQLTDVTAKVAMLGKDVSDLKAPVAELVNIKRRSVAFVAFVASVAAVAWTVAQPIWSWVIQRWLSVKG